MRGIMGREGDDAEGKGMGDGCKGGEMHYGMRVNGEGGDAFVRKGGGGGVGGY